MSNILDGKEVSKKVRLELKEEVERMKKEKNIIPKLAVIIDKHVLVLYPFDPIF